MYHYGICNEPDEKIFKKQCDALEKCIPNLKRCRLLEDVDGSKTQLYLLGKEEISVHNSYYIGAVYIDSHVELTHYFNKNY